MTATKTLLLRHGLHFTAQRAALYEALAATRSHPTAEELYRVVRPQTRSLSLATVYSALETFCRVGLARKVATPEGACRYDAATGEHVHVRDVRTGAIRDVPAELGARLLEAVPAELLGEIEHELGVWIEGLEIQIQASPKDGRREADN